MLLTGEVWLELNKVEEGSLYCVQMTEAVAMETGLVTNMTSTLCYYFCLATVKFALKGYFV